MERGMVTSINQHVCLFLLAANWRRLTATRNTATTLNATVRLTWLTSSFFNHGKRESPSPSGNDQSTPWRPSAAFLTSDSYSHPPATVINSSQVNNTQTSKSERNCGAKLKVILCREIATNTYCSLFSLIIYIFIPWSIGGSWGIRAKKKS